MSWQAGTKSSWQPPGCCSAFLAGCKHSAILAGAGAGSLLAAGSCAQDVDDRLCMRRETGSARRQTRAQVPASPEREPLTLNPNAESLTLRCTDPSTASPERTALRRQLMGGRTSAPLRNSSSMGGMVDIRVMVGIILGQSSAAAGHQGAPSSSTCTCNSTAGHAAVRSKRWVEGLWLGLRVLRKQLTLAGSTPYCHTPMAALQAGNPHSSTDRCSHDCQPACMALQQPPLPPVHLWCDARHGCQCNHTHEHTYRVEGEQGRHTAGVQLR